MEKLGNIIIAILLMVAVTFLYAVPVVFLWNWLMPVIFGLTKISFFQALGLSFLIEFLIKKKI